MEEDNTGVFTPKENSHPYPKSPQENKIVIDLKPDGSYTVEDPVISQDERINSKPIVEKPPVIIDAEPLYPINRDEVEKQIRAEHPNWSESLITMVIDDTLNKNRILNMDIKSRSGRR